MDITRVDEVTCDEGFIITLCRVIEDCPGVILLEEHEDVVVVVFIMNLSTAIRNWMSPD